MSCCSKRPKRYEKRLKKNKIHVEERIIKDPLEKKSDRDRRHAIVKIETEIEKKKRIEFHQKFISEIIPCGFCKTLFALGDSQLQINCAGCDKFFHCGIAGKCIGKNCNSDTSIGTNHKLSWCVNCVPPIPFNKEKVSGDGYCLCTICFNSH